MFGANFNKELEVKRFESDFFFFISIKQTLTTSILSFIFRLKQSIIFDMLFFSNGIVFKYLCVQSE